MLVIWRRPGQGAEIRDRRTGNKFGFLYNGVKNGALKFTINGENALVAIDEGFYLDPYHEVLVVIVESDSGLRIGIDANDNWDIRRSEVQFIDH